MSNVGDFHSQHIGGDKSIVKVDDHIFLRQPLLQEGYIDVGDGLTAVDCLADGCTGCLAGKNCGRDHTHHVPGIPLCADAAACCDQIVEAIPDQGAVGTS